MEKTEDSVNKVKEEKECIQAKCTCSNYTDECQTVILSARAADLPKFLGLLGQSTQPFIVESLLCSK